MKCEINYNTINESHLEPYIGWRFNMIKQGIKVSWISWFGKRKKISNKYINFIQCTTIY